MMSSSPPCGCMRSAAAALSLSLLLLCVGALAAVSAPQQAAAQAAGAGAVQELAGQGASQQLAPLASKKVDVDLFVMSKCPDAMFCEAFLAPLLDDLKYHINLQMHYIGFKQDDGSWQCKHGADECAGNTQQLCVQQFTSEYNRVNLLLNFILCNNRDGEVLGSFATATKCLKEVGAPVVDGTKMVACMYSPGRQAVLESDFAQTALLGVKTSCTIRFDGNDVCVRDGGEWKDCPAGSSLADFKQLLCAAYAAKNKGQMPRTCQDIPSQLAVS